MDKTCIECSRTLPTAVYFPAPQNADGLASRCKRCAILASAKPIGDLLTRAENAELRKQRAAEPDPPKAPKTLRAPRVEFQSGHVRNGALRPTGRGWTR